MSLSAAFESWQDIQERLFKALGLSEEQLRRRFGFFLDALTYGTPPMARNRACIDRRGDAARRRKIHPRK